MTGFYYVGTKRAIITKLVNIYKRGYASGKLDESMTELLNKEHILPQVIICDASYGFAAVKQWSDLLTKNERLHGIPLIIDSENMNAIENFQFIRNKTADDIINLQESGENDLKLKISKYEDDIKLINLDKRDPHNATVKKEALEIRNRQLLCKNLLSIPYSS